MLGSNCMAVQCGTLWTAVPAALGIKHIHTVALNQQQRSRELLRACLLKEGKLNIAGFLAKKFQLAVLAA